MDSLTAHWDHIGRDYTIRYASHVLGAELILMRSSINIIRNQYCDH